MPAKRFKIDNHNILFVTELSEYENINYVTEYGFNENSVKNANELLDRLNENFPNTSSSLKTMLEEVKNGSENNIKRIKISPKLLDVLDISNQNYKNIQGVSFIVGKDSIVVFLYSKSDLSYDNNTSTLIDFNTNTLEANVLNKLLIFLYGSNLQFKNENMFSDIGVYLNDIIDENFSVEMLHDGLISDELRGYLKQIKYYEQMYEANKTEFLKNDMSKDQFMMLPDKVKDNRLNCI